MRTLTPGEHILTVKAIYTSDFKTQGKIDVVLEAEDGTRHKEHFWLRDRTGRPNKQVEEAWRSFIKTLLYPHSPDGKTLADLKGKQMRARAEETTVTRWSGDEMIVTNLRNWQPYQEPPRDEEGYIDSILSGF